MRVMFTAKQHVHRIDRVVSLCDHSHAALAVTMMREKKIHAREQYQ